MQKFAAWQETPIRTLGSGVDWTVHALASVVAFHCSARVASFVWIVQ
jgi:hypothetical protein